jgi:hypothetical protein
MIIRFYPDILISRHLLFELKKRDRQSSLSSFYKTLKNQCGLSILKLCNNRINSKNHFSAYLTLKPETKSQAIGIGISCIQR